MPIDSSQTLPDLGLPFADPTRLLWLRGLRTVTARVLSTPSGLVGGSLVLLFVITACLAPVVAPYDPDAQDLANTLASPSWDHPMGTDQNGRDVLSRVIFGTRVSLAVGLLAIAAATAVGMPLGLISGFYGRGPDLLMTRVMDALYSFPTLILAVAVVSVLGAGLTNVVVALSVTTVPTFFRLARIEALSLKERDFVLAARSIGAGDRRLLLRHITPNSLSPIVVQAALTLGFAILTEAGLSFLGVGIQPPTATWGQMISQAYRFINLEPMLALFPGLALCLLILGTNLLGDALRDALDPRFVTRHDQA